MTIRTSQVPIIQAVSVHGEWEPTNRTLSVDRLGSSKISYGRDFGRQSPYHEKLETCLETAFAHCEKSTLFSLQFHCYLGMLKEMGGGSKALKAILWCSVVERAPCLRISWGHWDLEKYALISNPYYFSCWHGIFIKLFNLSEFWFAYLQSILILVWLFGSILNV